MTTRALEDSEIQKIFDCVEGCNSTRNTAILTIGIGLALRASEVCGLNVGDVVDDNGNVKTYVTIRGEIAKFGKERTVRIGDGLKQSIQDFISWKRTQGEGLDTDSPLFRSQMSGHLCRTSLHELIKKIFNNAGIDQSCHSLRKTGATIYYIESGYDLIATQQFLGHADPSTTRRYIGLTTEQLSEYSERLSDHLFSAIRTGEKVKLDTNYNTSNFSWTDASDSYLFIELAKRGFDISGLIDQTKEKKEGKIIKFPKVA